MLEIAALVASTGFTLWKAYVVVKDILRTRNLHNFYVLMRIISAAVQQTYEEFVRERKLDHEKLT